MIGWVGKWHKWGERFRAACVGLESGHGLWRRWIGGKCC
jgi:hypothetical protein